MNKLALLCFVGLAVQLASAAIVIKDFTQVDGTATSVTLQWALNSTARPLKYTLIINDLLTQEFLPPSNMKHKVEALEACTVYTFKLTATFEGEVTAAVHTSGNTDYLRPEKVGELSMDEASVLSWTAPGNAQCVAIYEVCWISTTLSVTKCDTTTNTSYSLSDLTGCDHLKLSVTGITPNNQKGPVSSIQIDSEYGDPSPPINFSIRPLNNFRVELLWDYPIENPACVQRYSITYGPYDNRTEMNTVEFFPYLRSDVTATLSNLSACTNYQFDVASLSIKNIMSESAIQYMETEYMPPGLIAELELFPTKTQMNVQWGDMLQDACLQYIEICHTDTMTMLSSCTNVLTPDLIKNITIEGLEPCRTYDFVAVGVSKTDEFGPPTTASESTLDTAPGAVTNMVVETKSTTSLEVKFDPPTVRPECVEQYIISYKNLLETKSKQEPRQTQNDLISGLDACTNYEVSVAAKSGSNQQGSTIRLKQKTLSQKPGIPRNLNAVTVSKTSITVVWFSPVDRYCVNSYLVEFTNADNSHDTFQKHVDATDYPEEILFTQPELTPCTTYSVKVWSINAVEGTNPTSATITGKKTMC